MSTQSTRAFKVAVDIAKKYDSKLTLLTCLEGDAWHHKFYDARADSELIKKQKSVSQKHLEKLKVIADKNNVSIKSNILTSKSVVNDIVNFAKSRKYDLIVIGSHGRTGFDKALLGSVANGVSQKARCPVLIVK
ncbi:UspA domain-containing protein [Candidatus Nitrosopumilus koreensis AR1]|uniref:UspA domain-containing protein n=1 Tax=Candidatus Nitrosopumilus koreensis AR1 TaxID=1229908 RepID=K0B6L4_9ARCH|nr:universal stress protein [Candidatus Nitrosopumilus koreensis]AFS80590.1 UspA domain-containing protein [Candidatus Nitrosopumilus koreensis AR1]